MMAILAVRTIDGTGSPAADARLKSPGAPWQKGYRTTAEQAGNALVVNLLAMELTPGFESRPDRSLVLTATRRWWAGGDPISNDVGFRVVRNATR